MKNHYPAKVIRLLTLCVRNRKEIFRETPRSLPEEKSTQTRLDQGENYSPRHGRYVRPRRLIPIVHDGIGDATTGSRIGFTAPTDRPLDENHRNPFRRGRRFPDELLLLGARLGPTERLLIGERAGAHDVEFTQSQDIMRLPVKSTNCVY